MKSIYCIAPIQFPQMNTTVKSLIEIVLGLGLNTSRNRTLTTKQTAAAYPF